MRFPSLPLVVSLISPRGLVHMTSRGFIEMGQWNVSVAVRGWQLPTPRARCELEFHSGHRNSNFEIFMILMSYLGIYLKSLSGSHFDLHGETRWWTNWFFFLRHFWTKKPSGSHWGLHHAWRFLPRLPPARCKRGGRGVLAPTWPRQLKGEIWRLDPDFHAVFDVSGYWN